MKQVRKILLITIALMGTIFYGNAQTDPALLKRIDFMLKATQNMEVEKILDYTYSKIFDIAPREQMAEAIKGALITEEFTATLDSLYIIKVHPTFKIGNGEYALVMHNMVMHMKFKEALDDAGAKEMIAGMEESFGKGNVRLDKKLNTIIIKNKAKVVAIKDEHCTDWMFVNYAEDSPLAGMIFSDELVEKLKSYK